MNKDLDFMVGDNAAQRLMSLIERVERLNEEKDALGEDITEVFKEAKSDGFDTKIMRKVIQLRKMDPADRLEQEQLIETYMAAVSKAAPK